MFLQRVPILVHRAFTPPGVTDMMDSEYDVFSNINDSDEDSSDTSSGSVAELEPEPGRPQGVLTQDDRTVQRTPLCSLCHQPTEECEKQRAVVPMLLARHMSQAVDIELGDEDDVNGEDASILHDGFTPNLINISLQDEIMDDMRE